MTAVDRRRMFDHYLEAGRVRGEYLNRCALIEELVTGSLLKAVMPDEIRRVWLGKQVIDSMEFGRKIELLKDALKTFRPDLFDYDLFDRLGRVNKFRKTWAHGSVNDLAAAAGKVTEGHIQLTTRGGKIETIKPNDIKRRLDDAHQTIMSLLALQFNVAMDPSGDTQ